MEVIASGLSKSYGKVTALKGVSFEASDGSFLTFLGPSGSGKTTILRCLAGVENPDEGTIRIGERVVFDSATGVNLPPEERGIGMVYQSYALWPHMTAADNIAYPLKLRKDPEAERKSSDVISLLKLDGLSGRFPYQLSGGEQQRVALARAVVYRPSVVLLDEPFSNLDVPLKEALRDELKQLQQRLKTTMIYVTHDRTDALSLSDQIVLLNSGRVAATGSPLSLTRRPPNSYAAGFLDGMLVIDAELSKAGNETALARTSYGTLEVPNAGALFGKVKLCVPPAGLTLVDDGVANTIPGSVSGIVRRPGGELSLRVSTESGSVEIEITDEAGRESEVGEVVFLRVEASRCVILES